VFIFVTFCHLESTLRHVGRKASVPYSPYSIESAEYHWSHRRWDPAEISWPFEFASPLRIQRRVPGPALMKGRSMLEHKLQPIVRYCSPQRSRDAGGR